VTIAAETLIGTWRQLVEAALVDATKRSGTQVEELWSGMRYSLLGGGKRLRPLLALATAHALEGAAEDALPAGVALEMIHTYSLIHDDLPAMDDDALRRGQPTNHVVHGEAMAILAGDALHTAAFETIAAAPLPAERRARLVLSLARASGAEGMAGGQALDLVNEGARATEELVERIDRLKTGALITASFRMGAEAIGAGEDEVAGTERIGAITGLAFQIRDDLLDETASTEDLGKTAGKDRSAGKVTWPAAVGREEAERRVRGLGEEALDAIARLGERASPLAALVRQVVERRSG
jgi:geranylgeranyl pyrophosphate synthase